MLLLFTSSAENKYMRDALAALALPPRSVIRFRYDAKYVSPELQKAKCRKDGTIKGVTAERALLVYADGTKGEALQPFKFFPLRFGRVVQIQKVGSAYYVDTELLEYPLLCEKLDAPDSCLSIFRRAVTANAQFPVPTPPPTGRGRCWIDGQKEPVERDYPLADGQPVGSPGNFLDRRESFESPDTAKDDSVAWQRVVSSLSESSLKNSAFFRIGGFFRVGRRWRRRFVDKRITPKPRWPEVEYDFPMGSHIVMTVEMRRGVGSTLDAFQLNIELGGDSLAAIEPKKLLLESRYDQTRVVIASRRVLDAVMTTIGVTCGPVQGPSTSPAVVLAPGSGATVSASSPFGPTLAFVIRVRASRWITVFAPTAAAIAAFLLAVTPDFVSGVGDLVHSQFAWTRTGPILISSKTEIALVAKAFAFGLSIVAAWLVFRKAPVGK